MPDPEAREPTSPLDSLRPRLPPPPSRAQVIAHRAGILIGWTIGYRRVARLDASLQVLFPWLLSLAIDVPLAVIFDGTIRRVAVGLAVGLLIGGVFSSGLHRGTIRRTAAHLLEREVELLRYADDRAFSVARQFEWAVDDLLNTRRTVRDQDATLAALHGELRDLRTIIDGRDRELATAGQKLFEVGLFNVDRERLRVQEMEEAVAASRAELGQVHAENARLRADADAAARRIASLSSTLRRVNEVSTAAERGSEEQSPAEFSWKLEFDGRENLLRMKLIDDELVATGARVLDGETVIARQSEAGSGEASIDHDRTVGWQTVAVDDAIVDRFRRSDLAGLRFEFIVEGDWLMAVPEVAKAVAAPRIWSIDGRRAARKTAVG